MGYGEFTPRILYGFMEIDALENIDGNWLYYFCTEHKINHRKIQIGAKCTFRGCGSTIIYGIQVEMIQETGQLEPLTAEDTHTIRTLYEYVKQTKEYSPLGFYMALIGDVEPRSEDKYFPKSDVKRMKVEDMD